MLRWNLGFGHSGQAGYIWSNEVESKAYFQLHFDPPCIGTWQLYHLIGIACGTDRPKTSQNFRTCSGGRS